MEYQTTPIFKQLRVIKRVSLNRLHNLPNAYTHKHLGFYRSKRFPGDTQGSQTIFELIEVQYLNPLNKKLYVHHMFLENPKETMPPGSHLVHTQGRYQLWQGPDDKEPPVIFCFENKIEAFVNCPSAFVEV